MSLIFGAAELLTTALTMVDAFTTIVVSMAAVEGAVEAAVGVSDGLSDEGMVADGVTMKRRDRMAGRDC